MDARWVGVFGLCCWAAAFAATAAFAEDPHVTQGRELYVEYCGACHGTAADGAGPAAAAMDPRPADLRRIAARRGGVFPAASVTDKIDGRDPIKAHGSRDMPVWGKVFRDDAEIEQGTETAVRGRILVLVEYLKSIQIP